MNIEIKTNSRAENYNVTIEDSAIERAGRIIKPLVKNGAKAMIISETNVFPIYGKKLEEALHKEGIAAFRFIFDAGEESKKLSTVYRIYETLAENSITRSDFIVTLGGGVAGDMGGYAAATYLRGIDFVQVPTSLLSQVDASVGGKTGVDLEFGKNLVGAFHQPIAVITDPQTLKTLPNYYIKDGLGEVIKYGCICDKNMFEELENVDAFGNEKSYGEIITKCIKAKKSFVEEDTEDKGKRMVLNFGHTFGHSLEKLHNFKDLSHGMAVGVGMVIAAQVGENLGITEKGTSLRIKALLEKYQMPFEASFSKEDIIAATKLDKKSSGDKLNLILLESIGKSVIHETDRETVLSAME